VIWQNGGHYLESNWYLQNDKRQQHTMCSFQKTTHGSGGGQAAGRQRAKAKMMSTDLQFKKKRTKNRLILVEQVHAEKAR